MIDMTASLLDLEREFGMRLVSFAPLPRRSSFVGCTEPLIRLRDNKGGHSLVLNAVVLEATGLTKGDELVLQRFDQSPALVLVRRRVDGESAHGLLTQAKKERSGGFSVGASLLMNERYGPGEVRAMRLGPGFVLFDASGFPSHEPEATAEEGGTGEPPRPKAKPWPLDVSPRVAAQILRSLLSRVQEANIASECLVAPAIVESVKRFVTPNALAIARSRSRPGQEKWVEETEEMWSRKYRASP